MYFVVNTATGRRYAKPYVRLDWAQANAHHRSMTTGKGHIVVKMVPQENGRPMFEIV